MTNPLYSGNTKPFDDAANKIINSLKNKGYELKEGAKEQIAEKIIDLIKPDCFPAKKEIDKPIGTPDCFPQKKMNKMEKGGDSQKTKENELKFKAPKNDMSKIDKPFDMSKFDTEPHTGTVKRNFTEMHAKKQSNRE